MILGKLRVVEAHPRIRIRHINEAREPQDGHCCKVDEVRYDQRKAYNVGNSPSF